MTQSTDVFVTWSEYRRLIETLAVQIYDSGWQFNQILCLARGGLRIGDVLSRIYNQPLAVLAASSYYGDEFRTRGDVRFSQTLTSSETSLGDRILLVDDLVDSGATLVETLKWLETYYQVRPENCRSAVLWYKECSAVIPDYFVERFADSPWIHQPFETYENLELLDLVARYKQQGSMLKGGEKISG